MAISPGKPSPKDPDIPSDLKQQLLADHVWEDFIKLAPSHRIEYIRYLDDARKPETRLSRLKKVTALLSKKKQA